MVATDQGGVRRRRKRVNHLPHARFTMDEVEYRIIYNQVNNAIQAQKWDQALLLLLQIIDSHQQKIEEMQNDGDDEDGC